MKGPNRRRQVFVNRLVQGRILMRIACYWFFYNLALWHTLFLFRWGQYRLEVLNGGTPLTFAELYGSFSMQYYPIVLTALATAPLLMWDILKLTHRVAGPLVRFNSTLQQLMAGQHVERVTLREGDLLLEFRDEFNAFLAYYNEQMARLKSYEAQSQIGCTENELLAQVQELQSATREQEPSSSEAMSTES